MSDQKLRELERRWRETKSVDDEAAYLRERVRVGDLTQERLELAAYCGHEGAKRATEPSQVPGGFRAWVEGLRRWGAEPLLAVWTTVAQAVSSAQSGGEMERAVEAVTAAILCPCARHRDQAMRAYESAEESALAEFIGLGIRDPSHLDPRDPRLRNYLRGMLMAGVAHAAAQPEPVRGIESSILSMKEVVAEEALLVASKRGVLEWVAIDATAVG